MTKQVNQINASKCEEEEGVRRKANQANNKATPLGQI
jgi:hypothetical protein